MVEQNLREPTFFEAMSVGWTRQHWFTAARATLAILTLGLSELLRGQQGWCAGCCFPKEGGMPMAQGSRQASDTGTGIHSARIGDTGNHGGNGHGESQYPVGGYEESEPEQQIDSDARCIPQNTIPEKAPVQQALAPPFFQGN